ncbi:tRNA (N6-isopentenyl adenosine(37)-C2)-methylthiotransferase MiaB [Bacteroidales bacterium OttesenSCG-928-I21]|nr:tRNA (N6-isopentenyl adenosine(37)-C2)-methylthiotransferase MiaB [Bacteroidales bacterium OttesenSCG-928-I21]
MKRTYIETYGCQMNVADSETVFAIMQEKNFIPETNIENADVVIINTCSVRDNAEQKIWNRLDYLKGLRRRKKGLKVGVIGCMAQRVAEDLLTHEAVDFVAGPDSYRYLPDLVNEADIELKTYKTDFDISETYSGIEPLKNKNEISGFIAITRGCNNFCSYCIVPYTRGRERSRNIHDILSEVKILKENGYKEITLLGQNVNSYSYDDNGKIFNFPKLIKSVAEAVPEIRIRFTTSHPKDISDELINVISKTKNICNHIHLPVQSGSNKILELMNRKYTREWYLERIETIKTLIPDCGLSSDIFCGFSGETEEDFCQTLDLMEKVEYDSAFMFKYSERPGTFAAKNLEDNVPENIKIERLNKMIDLQNKISDKKNKAEIGKVLEVLVEGYSKRSNDMLFGRTEQNRVVVFPKQNAKKGDFVMVKILDAGSATLKGEIYL